MSSTATSSTQLSLQQLQRRFDRLRQLQRRIRQPPAHSFEAYGRTYLLPLAARGTRLRKVPLHSLEYLAGFFNGDGCAYSAGSGQRVRLEIEQSIANVKVLLLFRSVFGGGIYSGRDTAGLQRSLIRWRTAGEGAKHAAALLGTVPCCKQPQLKIVSSWPRAMSEMQHAAARLKLLKQTPPSTSACVSWTFLAGFFDAEG